MLFWLTFTVTLSIIIKFQLNSAADQKDGIYSKFTQVQCKCPELSFCKVERCDLKAFGPTRSGYYMNITMKRTPITTMQLYFDILRLRNGKYVPSYLNFTTDFCKFQRDKSRNRFFSNLYKYVEYKFNFNHSCPFHENNFIIQNLSLYHNSFFNFIPGGNYKVKTQVKMGEKVRLTMDFWIEHRNTKNSFLN